MQPAVVQHPWFLRCMALRREGLSYRGTCHGSAEKALGLCVCASFVWSDFECSSDTRAARVLLTLVAEPTALSGKIRDATA